VYKIKNKIYQQFIIMSLQEKKEARRRKILANSEERLKKLNSIKSGNRTGLALSDIIQDDQDKNNADAEITLKLNNQDQTKNVEFEKVLKNENEIIKTETTGIDENEINDELESSNIDNKMDEGDHTVVNSDPKDDVIQNNTNYSNKKYRALIFLVLAWCIYAVVVQGFDIYLAYFIGQRLPKEGLATLFLSAFVAVELQLVLLEVFVIPRSQNEKKSTFVLSLMLCGVPARFIQTIQRLHTCVMNIVTDFSIYLFFIVLLHAMENSI